MTLRCHKGLGQLVERKWLRSRPVVILQSHRIAGCFYTQDVGTQPSLSIGNSNDIPKWHGWVSPAVLAGTIVLFHLNRIKSPAMNAYSKDNLSYAYNPVITNDRTPWRASLWRRLPWLGFGALLGVLAGIAAAITILVLSDEQPVKSWNLQPTVCLAIVTAITNILLHFALTEGVNVAWWKRATDENTEVADLHRYWSYGNSLLAAMTSGRHINMVAVACMFVAIGPVNGPLLQRASRVTVARFQQTSNVRINIAQELPNGYTGFLSGRGLDVGLLAPAFTQTVQGENNQAMINVTAAGCTGQCNTTIPGAGFAINCSVSTMPYALTPEAPEPGETFNTSQEAVANGTLSFGSYMEWSFQNPGIINLGVQYKNDPACDGELQIRNCTMTAAVVDYPVIINGNKSTIELLPGSSMFDDKVINQTEVALTTTSSPTTLGGFGKALSNTYNSEANLRFVGAVGYELITTGATANRYAVIAGNSTSGSGTASYANCDLSFTDPSNDLVQGVRSLMFRTAIAAANSSIPADSQYVTAQESTTLPIYESHYLYLGLAVLVTSLGWLAMLPIFGGWWHVGRTVTMSPVETGKAFRAPMLASSDGNAEIDKLLKEVGTRPIRYGAVATGGEYSRLELHEPRYMQKPWGGQTFGG